MSIPMNLAADQCGYPPLTTHEGYANLQLTELELLRGAMAVAVELLKRPVHALLLHSTAINELNETYKRLDHEVRKYKPEQYLPPTPSSFISGEGSPPVQQIMSPPITPQTPVLEIPKAVSLDSDARNMQIRSLLAAAVNSIPQVCAATKRFEMPASDVPINHRLIHVQNILSIQKKKVKISETSPERILAICACRSLAIDFYEFEQQLNLRPKEDILLERITQSMNTHIHTIDKNLSQFLTSKFPGQMINAAKLESALRLGIKLGLVETIGKRIGIESLGLFLGFECAKLTRVPFYAFSQLEVELRNADIIGRVRDFDLLMKHWWMNCKSDYHSKYRAD